MMSDLDRYKILSAESDVENNDVITRIVFDDLESEIFDSVNIEEHFSAPSAAGIELDDTLGHTFGTLPNESIDEGIPAESIGSEEAGHASKKAYWLMSLITAMVLFSSAGWLWWEARSEGDLSVGGVIEKVWRKDKRNPATVLLKMDPFIVPFTSKEKTIGIVNLEIEVEKKAQFEFLSQIGRAREVIFTFLRESAVSLRREQSRALVERINKVIGNEIVVSIHAIRGQDKAR